ncbi:metallophosphoesterase [Agrococcus sp. SGAir0287]|uniref:metallophosphoesterase n=1 Tax=Agrococcus sp. SGAir0287 TaxID=2070347 RepID=UPI0010CD43A7|nr:hypothetical protein C1N71_09100 [Agrococcus sp. SGAir0287]
MGLIVVGDVHGCVEPLRLALSWAANFKDRRVVLVGDYIDRGPASKEVIETLIREVVAGRQPHAPRRQSRD